MSFLEPSHGLPGELGRTILSKRYKNSKRNVLENDTAYRTAKSDFDSFVEGMTSALSKHVDDTIPTELPLKDLVGHNSRYPSASHLDCPPTAAMIV